MLKKLVNTWGTSGICFETSKAYDALVGHSLVSDTMLYPLLTLSIFRRSLKHQGCIRHVMFDNSTEHTHRNSQLTRDMFIVQTIKSMMLLVMCLYMLLTVDFLDVPKSDSLVLFLTWMLSLFREWAYRITNLKTFIYNLRKCWMSASFFGLLCIYNTYLPYRASLRVRMCSPWARRRRCKFSPRGMLLIWLVVDLPLWKIWKSVGKDYPQHIMENKRWYPPSDVNWFIIPMKYRYIYHKPKWKLSYWHQVS